MTSSYLYPHLKSVFFKLTSYLHTWSRKLFKILRKFPTLSHQLTVLSSEFKTKKNAKAMIYNWEYSVNKGANKPKGKTIL